MKQVHLTLIETTCGKDDRTIATVRATKHGKQAELQFVGETGKRRFPTVQKAWEWLCQTPTAKTEAPTSARPNTRYCTNSNRQPCGAAAQTKGNTK